MVTICAGATCVASGSCAAAGAGHSTSAAAAIGRRRVTGGDVALSLVGRRPVELRQRDLVHAQVHRQLRTVMHEMVDGVSEDVFPPPGADDLAAVQQSPRQREVGVAAPASADCKSCTLPSNSRSSVAVVSKE